MRRMTGAVATGLLATITAIATFAIMAVSFSDVTARSFAHSLGGAYEITEMLVGVTVFSALPLVTWQGKHVTVGFLDPLLKQVPMVRKGVKIFARLVVVGACLFLGYHLVRLGNQMWARDARAIFAGVPLAPFAWFAASMCFLSALAEALRPETDIVGEEF